MVDNITIFWAITLTGFSIFTLAVVIFLFVLRQPKK